jgi:hypothetical protein
MPGGKNVTYVRESTGKACAHQQKTPASEEAGYSSRLSEHALTHFR